MELELSEYQELLRSTTRSFLDAASPLSAVRALADDPDGFDRATWRKGCELGWTSLLVTEADGGGSVSGDGVADLVLVAEELGRLVAPGPFVPGNVVASALGALADGARRREVLAGITSGELIAAWAADDPPGAPPTVLADDPGGTGGAGAGGLVLTGAKATVEAGAQADVLLVSARRDARPVQVLVAADAPGVTIDPLGGLDLVRRFADVRFDAVAVAAADVVGTAESAADDIRRQGTLASVLQSAETVGAITRMFEVTVDMLGDRYSFGRQLSSYQALKHRCADLKLTIEACAATATAAARALSAATRAADPAAGTPADHALDDAAELASVAAAYIGPAATAVIQDCVQLHGGIGVTWDHDLHLYLRRVAVNRATYGTPDQHLDRIADTLLGVPA